MSFLDKLNNLSNFFGINDDVDDYEGDVVATNQRNNESAVKQSERSPQQANNFRRPVQQSKVVAMSSTSNQGNKEIENRTAMRRPTSDRIVASKTKTREDYLTNKEYANSSESTKRPINHSSRERFSTEPKRNQDSRPKITIKQPRVYSDAMKIAEFCMNDEAVLVNFHYMEEFQARRVIDFLTGIAYALHGDLQRVGNQIFLLTPASIQIDGNEAKSLVDSQDFDYEI